MNARTLAPVLVLPAALLLLAACESQVDFRSPGPARVQSTSTFLDAPRPSAGPPPGRTAAERSARREYYQGPRGQEF